MNLNLGILDIIEVVIGFVLIILLMSIVVTSMVQAIQSTFRLRARNLKNGLRSIIQIICAKDKGEANLMALKVLNAKNINILENKDDPTKWWHRLRGPVISYVNPGELPEALKDASVCSSSEVEEKFLLSFDRIENQMENNFLKWMRGYTFGCALIVAVCFQVSTPALFARLASDDNLRSQLVEAANGEMKQGGPPAYGDVSDMALIRLGAKYPEQLEKIEEASGVGGGKDSLVDELDDVLEGVDPDLKAKILKSYETLIVEMHEERVLQATVSIETNINKLSKYYIAVWPYGEDFYWGDDGVEWSNLLGVLITAILLCFGAPFWFERLKEAIKLKDLLSKGIKRDDGKDKPVG